MWSFDFGEIETLQHAGRWDDAAAELIAAAQCLERGGADFVVICTRTRCTAWPIRCRQRSACRCCTSRTPTAERIKRAGLRKVGLLGTAFTMEQDFYRGRLADRHGLEVLVPDDLTASWCTG